MDEPLPPKAYKKVVPTHVGVNPVLGQQEAGAPLVVPTHVGVNPSGRRCAALLQAVVPTHVGVNPVNQTR